MPQLIIGVLQRSLSDVRRPLYFHTNGIKFLPKRITIFQWNKKNVLCKAHLQKQIKIASYQNALIIVRATHRDKNLFTSAPKKKQQTLQTNRSAYHLLINSDKNMANCHHALLVRYCLTVHRCLYCLIPWRHFVRSAHIFPHSVIGKFQGAPGRGTSVTGSVPKLLDQNLRVINSPWKSRRYYIW